MQRPPQRRPRLCPEQLPKMCAHTLGAYLDLHGHLAAPLQAGQVHLPDGGGCEGPLLEVLQLVPPVGAQVVVESFLEGEARERL